MPPTPPDDLSTLERMRRRLYAADAPEGFEAPSLARPAAPAAPESEGWMPPAPPSKKPRLSYAALFLGIAALFFVLAIAGAAYFLVFGSRSVSTDHIVISPDGPTAISSGDTVTLLISIENQNPVAAKETMLSVEFPDTARSPENQEEPFLRYEDTVGDIGAGEIGTRSVRAVLFGAENEHVIIPIRLEYRIEGSNAVYVKEAEYDVVITSSPISISAEAVTEASAGQLITFAVRVRSNAKEDLHNVAVLAEYPFGFQATRGQGPVYPVGTLAPGEERTIAVSGILAGEDDDERVFRFTAGTRKDENVNLLTVSYASTPVAVGLKKPFLQATLSVDRDTSASPVVAAGAQAQSIVSWVNTLSSSVLDGQVSVKLSGAALDPGSITVYSGFYRSSDMTIVYSKETDTGLGSLAPGSTGSGSFVFRTKSSAELAGVKNPTVVATISVAGRRFDEDNVPESVSSSLVRTIKVGTELSLAATSRYTTGPFKNTGPWPPVADQETTYTLDLALSNTVNSVADAVVTGTLPSYVRYVGATNPADGSVSYNAATRTVTWKAGDVAAGSGHGAASRQASFQVALLPSLSQRGTSPVLMSSITATGFDRFTEHQLSIAESDISTQTLGDPAFVQGKAEVR
jgi:hypothetical protein